MAKPKRNAALDNWLDASKAKNMELAEDPEARAAAEAQEAEARDSGHVDPTDTEVSPGPNDDNDGDPDAQSDEAARAAEEAAAAAAAETAAAGDGTATAKPEDEAARALKNSQEEAKRLKREKEETKRQLAETRRQLAELQARPAAPVVETETKPKPVEDPEPNATEFPVEHDQWLAREARREAAAAREETQSLRSEIDAIKTGNNQKNMETDFGALMDQEKANFKVDHPDFDARLDHIKTALRRQMAINGVPAHQIEAGLREQERKFLIWQTAQAHQMAEDYPGRYALERLSELAETYGYRTEDAAAATETAPVAPKNGKPAPNATTQIADRTKRAAAARTATTMSGTAPETHDPNAPMTADRFLRMSWADREAYKKAHPGTLDRIMSEGEEGGAGVHPLLVGR